MDEITLTGVSGSVAELPARPFGFARWANAAQAFDVGFTYRKALSELNGRQFQPQRGYRSRDGSISLAVTVECFG